MIFIILIILLSPFEKNPYLLLHAGSNFTVIKLLGIFGVFWAVWTSMTSSSQIGLFRGGTAKALVAYSLLLFASSLVSSVESSFALSRLIGVLTLFFIFLSIVRVEQQLRIAIFFLASEFVFVFPYAMRQLLRFDSNRLGVGVFEANYYALSLVVFFPLVFALLLLEKRPYYRVYWLAAVSIYVVSIVLTGSRGGFAGFGAAVIMIAARYGRRRVLVLAAFAVMATSVVVVMPNPLRDRLVGTFDESQSVGGLRASNDSRLASLEAGFQLFRDSPITGVGLGRFKPEMARLGYGLEARMAHNTYLELAAESGLFGVALFLSIIGATYWSLSRAQGLSRQLGFEYGESMAYAFKASLAGWTVGAVFLSAQYEKSLWLVVFSAMCLVRVVAERAAKESHKAGAGLPPRAEAIASLDAGRT